jgi:hypothetical protein
VRAFFVSSSRKGATTILIRMQTDKHLKMPGLVERIRGIKQGTPIPKPNSLGHLIIRWGKRRGEEALIYSIPNRNNPTKPYEKGIAISEFQQAFEKLRKDGEFTRKWFDRAMVPCAKEGGCNFTTIGGIFKILSLAQYEQRGRYVATILPDDNPRPAIGNG